MSRNPISSFLFILTFICIPTAVFPFLYVKGGWMSVNQGPFAPQVGIGQRSSLGPIALDLSLNVGARKKERVFFQMTPRAACLFGFNCGNGTKLYAGAAANWSVLRDMRRDRYSSKFRKELIAGLELSALGLANSFLEVSYFLPCHDSWFVHSSALSVYLGVGI